MWPHTLLMAAVLTAVAPAFAQETRPTQELVCNGGSTNQIEVWRDHAADEQPRTHMTVTFKWVALDVPGAAPAPGECAWVGRAYKQDEPDILKLSADSVTFTFRIWGDGTLVRHRNGVHLAPEHVGSNEDAQDFLHVVDRVMMGGVFTVHVDPDGRRALVVTGVVR